MLGLMNIYGIGHVPYSSKNKEGINPPCFSL